MTPHTIPDMISDDVSELRSQIGKRRLLAGLAKVLEERGLEGTRIVDIVTAASMSKRDFYEYFPDKDSCFLELYDLVSQDMVQALEEANALNYPSTTERLRAVIKTYLTLLEQRPALTRVHVVGIYLLGDRGLAARRIVIQRYSTAFAASLGNDALHPNGGALATAVTGGMNELILEWVEAGRASELSNLTEDALAFMTPHVQ